ncbi:MAG: ABC transporter ATP-binding protein [Gemmatimonadales bacterium]
MILEARNLRVRYGRGRPALDRVSLALEPGRLLGVVGPNGSGKSTLLRALLGGVPLDAGTVTIAGRPLEEWPARDLARVIGGVSQHEEHLFPLRVRDTVALGRYAHLGPVRPEREEDRLAVADAMERCDVGDLANRRTDTLSGGEWQRVRVARALAQEPRVMLLDEPTAALDVRHEMEVFELVRQLADDGLGALVVTHHLNLAARYADRLLLLTEGSPAAEGIPAEVLRKDVLERVFQWPVAVTTWCDGSPQVVPLRPGDPS